MQHYSTFIKGLTIFAGGVIAFCLGIASGYLVFHPDVLFHATQTQSQQVIAPVPSTSKLDKAAAFRLNLQQREQEYIVLLLQLSRSTYDSSDDISALTLQVTASVNERSALYGVYYGKDLEEKYKKIQTENVNDLIAYTNAVKRNNKIGMENTTKQLITNNASQSALFSTINKDLPSNGLNKLSTDTIILLKESIDAYASQNYPLAYSKQREAFAQSSDIAAAHANAILGKYPQKF